MGSMSSQGKSVWEGSGVAAETSIWSAVSDLLLRAKAALDAKPSDLSVVEAQEILDRWEHSARTGQPFEHERLVNGRIIQSILIPIKLDESSEPRWVGVNLDVTERASADARRHAIQNLHNATLESNGIGTWSVDVSSNTFQLSPISRELFGLALDSRIAVSELLSVVVDADRDLIPSMLDRSNTESVRHVDLTTIGHRRLRLSCAGEMPAIYGTVIDLEHDARRIISSFSGQSVPVYVFDRKLRLIAKNDFAESQTIDFVAVANPAITQALLSGKSESIALDQSHLAQVNHWADGVFLEIRAMDQGYAKSTNGTLMSTEELRKLGPIGASNWLESVPAVDQARVALAWNQALSVGTDFSMNLALRNGVIQRIEANRIDGTSGWKLLSVAETPAPEMEPSVRQALDHIRLGIAGLQSTPTILLDQAASQLSASERRALVQHVEAVSELRRSLDRLRLWGDLADAEPNRQSIDILSLIESDPEMLPSKRQTLNVSGTPVFADPRLMRIAMRELIRNCVQYAAEGPILVATTRDRIVVSDTGPGFPTEILASGPTPLRRGYSADSTPGDGLGLAIVARIARRHGGSLKLQNGPMGSTVEFSVD